MRIVTKEQLEQLEKDCPAYATIVHTPRPDFTELHRQSEEFAAWLRKEQEKDRKIIAEALKNAR